MGVVVLGATGPTGQQLVSQALTAGLKVTAVVRSPDKLPEEVQKNPNFNHKQADIFDAAALAAVFQGADVVFSCLGYSGQPMPKPGERLDFYLPSGQAIVQAVQQAAVKRLIVMTSWHTSYNLEAPDCPPLVKFIGPFLDDMRRMEEHVEKQAGDIDYTVVRPPGLLDAPMNGGTVLTEDNAFHVKAAFGGKGSGGMPRADIARFMLHCFTNATWKKHFVAIALE